MQDKLWSMFTAIGTILSVALIIWYSSLTNATQRGIDQEKVRTIEIWRPAIEIHLLTHDVGIAALQVSNAGLIPKIESLQKSVDDLNKKLDKMVVK